MRKRQSTADPASRDAAATDAGAADALTPDLASFMRDVIAAPPAPDDADAAPLSLEAEAEQAEGAGGEEGGADDDEDDEAMRRLVNAGDESTSAAALLAGPQAGAGAATAAASVVQAVPRTHCLGGRPIRRTAKPAHRSVVRCPRTLPSPDERGNHGTL
jgi:hypothetical protein